MVVYCHTVLDFSTHKELWYKSEFERVLELLVQPYCSCFISSNILKKKKKKRPFKIQDTFYANPWESLGVQGSSCSDLSKLEYCSSAKQQC